MGYVEDLKRERARERAHRDRYRHVPANQRPPTPRSPRGETLAFFVWLALGVGALIHYL